MTWRRRLSPLEQSSPDHMGSQWQVCDSRSKLPWPLQSGKHWRASLSMVLQSAPFQPFLHMHVPSAQNPWPEQVGCGQSASSQNLPLYPRTQLHFPLVQWPWPLQSGTSHSSWRNEHSLPFQPGLHWHSPLIYSPRWLQSTGQTLSLQSSPPKPGLHWQWPSKHSPLPLQPFGQLCVMSSAMTAINATSWGSPSSLYNDKNQWPGSM